MSQSQSETETLFHLIRWAENQPLVRAMLLTSTRAVANAVTDAFSDYDVILILLDVRPFFEDRAWLNAFGSVLALYRDPLELENGAFKSGYVIQFAEGLKIDFTLWQVEFFQRIAAAPQLYPELDAGYLVLIDKDHLTDNLQTPSYHAYIPTPPSAVEYLEKVEVFFVETTYIAKLLWRDDIIAAKEVMDHFMKQEDLIPMLIWRMEIDQHWSVKPGPLGRRLKQWLRPDLWDALETTYTGTGIEENWTALWNAIALMRRVSTEVGTLLGYTYPEEMDRRTMAYLSQVKALDRSATTFNPEVQGQSNGHT